MTSDDLLILDGLDNLSHTAGNKKAFGPHDSEMHEPSAHFFQRIWLDNLGTEEVLMFQKNHFGRQQNLAWMNGLSVCEATHLKEK